VRAATRARRWRGTCIGRDSVGAVPIGRERVAVQLVHIGRVADGVAEQEAACANKQRNLQKPSTGANWPEEEITDVDECEEIVDE
jgi:hypothetical protein